MSFGLLLHCRPLWRRQIRIIVPFTFRSLSVPTNNDKENGPLRKPMRKSTTSTTLDHWLDQLQSPPNIITVSRIASTPLLSYLVLTEQYEAALAGSLLAGLSDAADGYLAKRVPRWSTVLGSYLDPLADKILINVLAISLCYQGTLPQVLVGLWVGRDVTLMAATYWIVASRTRAGQVVVDPLTVPLKVEPTVLSKLNTALQFVTLSAGMVHPVYAVPGTLEVLCWVTAGTTVASFASYVGYSAFAPSGNKDKAD